MKVDKITIKGPEEVVPVYEKASASDRKRVLAYSLMSREEAAVELKHVLDQMGQTAKERGLTEDKLDELLGDMTNKINHDLP